MKTIWKFPLQINDYQKVEMPKGAIIRHVGLDPHDKVCLWAEVNVLDDYTETEERVIAIRGTGHPLPEGRWEYIGAVHMGPYVWHVLAAMPEGI